MRTVLFEFGSGMFSVVSLLCALIILFMVIAPVQVIAQQNHVQQVHNQHLLAPTKLDAETSYQYRTAERLVLYRLTSSAFVELLPVESALTYNSRRPYSFADRSFWAGKGLNSSLTLGVAFESRFLSIQLAPEMYYAQNLSFNSPLGVNYLYYLYPVDVPYRLQPDPFSKVSIGQSSVQLHVGWFEFGASTSTMSWGAGIRNQMILGQHAPGLPHLYAGMRRPVSLPFDIGQLSYNVMWAWPENSFYRSNRPDRFMSGLDVSFMPAFLEGLEVGLTRIFHSYIPEGGVTRSQLLDVFEAFLKEKLSVDERTSKGYPEDQMASAYISFTSKVLSTKIFGEYIREDHNWDLRDALTNPHNSRGYQFGVLKWFDGHQESHRVNILIEVSNASGANLDQVRSLQGLYVGGAVLEGHTNGGEMLGAAIGPGSTSAYIGYNQFMDWGRFGLSFEKVELAEFEYFEARSRYQPIESGAHRVNLHYGVDATFNFRGFILEPRVMGIQYFNEGWDPERDFWNWHLRLGITYPF